MKSTRPQRISIQVVLLEWLKFHMHKSICSHDIETHVPEYAKLYHGVLATPSTIARAWRHLREDKNHDQLLMKNGMALEDVSDSHPGRKEKTWKIRPWMSQAA